MPPKNLAEFWKLLDCNVKRRPKKLRAENLALESRWKLEGFTAEEITEKINQHNNGLCRPLTLRQIVEDLKQCRQMWAKAVVGTQNEMRVNAVQQLRRVRRVAWEAFEKSKEPSKRRAYEVEPTSGQPIGNVHMQEELEVGNPRFLEKVIQTISEECKILDLYPHEPLELDFDGKKHISVAVILNTGGETLEQLSYFPTRGELT
jgi:hypothetical protein